MRLWWEDHMMQMITQENTIKLTAASHAALSPVQQCRVNNSTYISNSITIMFLIRFLACTNWNWLSSSYSWADFLLTANIRYTTTTNEQYWLLRLMWPKSYHNTGPSDIPLLSPSALADQRRHQGDIIAPRSRVITRIPYSFWGITDTYQWTVLIT